MNNATGIAAFIFGAAAGSVATWYFTKKYYEQIAQEEIDSVKEVFSKKVATDTAESASDIDIEKTNEAAKQVTQTTTNYSNVVSNYGYSQEVKEGDKVDEQPYVIEPDEFGEEFDYEQIELTYYADGVLTDDFNEPIEDSIIEEYIGGDFADHFGEYEDDAVYIRNDSKKTEYCILADERNHSEVIRYKKNEVEMG